MKTYTLTPQDVLFFRDGRPIETGGGHGARWPEPSVIFDALHAALWRGFPEPQSWEHRHDFGRSSHRPQKGDTQRFGSLKTAGLFPVLADGRWLFPAAQDAVAASEQCDDWKLVLRPADHTRTNLPAPWLKYLPASYADPSKEEPAPWWTREAWRAYLRGERPHLAQCFTHDELLAGEWTTGIGIDPNTQTQDGERIYSAQYLRLRDGVRCGFAASLPMKTNGPPSPVRECIDQLLTDPCVIVVGGQQRTCQVRPAAAPLAEILPVAPSIQGPRLKWILLTPAIFPRIAPREGVPEHAGGWLPNWIDQATGRVKLKLRTGAVRRRWDQDKGRTVRQAEQEMEIGASLVAARLPKPVPIVGWTERLHLLAEERERWTGAEDQSAHGPRATHLAVPAGAVYYFEADSAEDAARLAAALNWHGGDPHSDHGAIKNRRSTLLGEKGFGLGVCGTWIYLSENQ